MLHTIGEFEKTWSSELEATQKLFKHLTTASLSQRVDAQGRTLGRLAWHIVTSIPEMMNRTGLTLRGPAPDAPVPASAREIFTAYDEAALALLEQVKAHWKDETLAVEDEMYGEKWKRSETLQALLFHQIHHRGQMTVLMRQAGLEIPGIYGPARQEWSAYGMPPPEV